MPQPSRRRWIKLWTQETLFGTTGKEMIPDERSVWLQFLALAGDSPDPGKIESAPRVAYTTLSLGKLESMNLYLCHGPATTHSLRQIIERMKLSYGVDVVFIDYLQLFRDRYGGNTNERMGFISGEVTSVAKEFNIPLVALSQLSRATEGRMDKRPHLSDLRESGSLEQDADLIIFLYRDSYYDREIDTDGAKTELLVSKDRLRGLVGGKIILYWDNKREKYISKKVGSSQESMALDTQESKRQAEKAPFPS